MEYTDFTISKRNGTNRLISSPNDKLKKAQRDLLPYLYRVLNDKLNEYDLSDVVHGFRPSHNCASSASPHIGYQVTIQMDITNFFNSVTAQMVNEYAANPSSPLVPDYCYHNNGLYCAQGFPTSPVLATLGSLEAFSDINNYLSHLTNNDFAFTVYADDLCISTNLPDIELQIYEIASSIESFMNKYGLNINNSKTRIRYAKYGYRRILGINVGDSSLEPTRKIKRKIRAAHHQSNNESIKGLYEWASNKLPNKL